MNNFVSLVQIKNKSFTEKSAYRSIIYCFDGEIDLNTQNLNLKIGKNNFVVINALSQYEITAKENYCAYILSLDESTLINYQLTVESDNGEQAILFCLRQLEIYSQNNSPLLGRIVEGLTNLIVSYITLIKGSGGINSLCEGIRLTIMQNLSNCDFKLGEYLKSLPLSYDYLKKLYKKQTGYTPYEYLKKVRLDRAKAILSGSDRFNYTIKEVALMSGYSDPLYFSRLFKQRFKYSPQTYAHRFDMPKKVKKPLGGVVENDV